MLLLLRAQEALLSIDFKEGWKDVERSTKCVDEQTTTSGQVPWRGVPRDAAALYGVKVSAAVRV